MKNTREQKRELHQLAKLHGILLAYDGFGRSFNYASEESLCAVIRALGDYELTSGTAVRQALRQKRYTMATRCIEPVVVAWENRFPRLSITLPEKQAHGSHSATLLLESGETRAVDISFSGLPVMRREEIEGTAYVTLRYTLPISLPFGYHRFRLELQGRICETTIISAPMKTYTGIDERRNWGAFLPLYALETENSMGCGDYSDLGALGGAVAEWGGSVVGTLPLLPLFLDKPYDISPYSPITRLAWNEFYIDPRKTPEFTSSRKLQELFESTAFQSALTPLRQNRLVDYRGIMDIKKRLLMEMSRELTRNPDRVAGLEKFSRNHPDVEAYAQFRAVMDSREQVWEFWPEHLRNGDIRTGDYDEHIFRYHLYSQWIAHRQIEELAKSAEKNGVTLYFDLPLGVHRHGYDVWRHRNIFAEGASSGAPPDAVFTNGQDWGFPPLHPEAVREDGYSYVRRYLRHHLSRAGMLRIDHVMGLHRLFWIPEGLDAAHGVYVRYRPEEFYAVLSIESNRSRCAVIGEDLGNVPGYVRRSMTSHGLRRMFIIIYELADSCGKTLGKIPEEMAAALNTHDMAPFATFWSGKDIDVRNELGLLMPEEVVKEKKEHQIVKNILVKFLNSRGLLPDNSDATPQVLEACLHYLASENDMLLLVNLEDLWLETEYQNIPGTTIEHPNWQHKARYRLEHIERINEVVRLLRDIDRTRRNLNAPGGE